MLPVAIGGAIVRLGNLFNSEIVGAVTDVSWGFKFVRLYPNVPIDSIPVQHPDPALRSVMLPGDFRNPLLALLRT